jgi:hypothetical protein
MNNALALTVILTVTFAFASSARAAPGEPRLVQGVLEWPAKLTVEPFVVVQTEDGQWYYAEIKAAKHLESSPLTAGTRVTVLGTEATRPYEITAIALGSGDAAALAMALMPLVKPTPATSASTAPPTVGSPSGSKSKPVASDPTAAESLQTSKAMAKPDSATAPSPPAKAPQPPAPETTVPTKPPSEAAAAPTSAPDSPRMAELRGTVKIVAGNWVVVQAADGQIVLVDLSTLSGGAASLKPGSSIAVYGTPTEQKFQAMGLIQQENRPPARPIPVPPRR